MLNLLNSEEVQFSFVEDFPRYSCFFSEIVNRHRGLPVGRKWFDVIKFSGGVGLKIDAPGGMSHAIIVFGAKIIKNNNKNNGRQLRGK